jgi:hypothetical protein
MNLAIKQILAFYLPFDLKFYEINEDKIISLIGLTINEMIFETPDMGGIERMTFNEVPYAKPILRSLDSLTTEQEINGEMVVPIKFLEKQFLAEGVLEYGESPYGWTGFYNESRKIYLPIHLDGEIMDECSWGIIQWLLQHHFNIFNLPETEFVDLNSRKSSN